MAAAAVAALVFTPTPANAQGFGPSWVSGGGCCRWADNGNHTYYLDTLTGGSYNAITFALGTRLEATVMTTDRFESWNNDTDLLVYDGLYPSATWWGIWACDVAVSGNNNLCNRGHITFNLSKGTPNNQLACQEVGHSVGLDHSSSTGSCMYQVAGPSVSTDFDAHDKGHINGFYL
jgi:hypothetical protein